MSIIRYKTTNTIINMKQEYKDFIALVARMREAQKEEAAFESEMDRKYRGNTWLMSTEELMKRQELCNKVFDLNSEVDEYLKKMKE